MVNLENINSFEDLKQYEVNVWNNLDNNKINTAVKFIQTSFSGSGLEWLKTSMKTAGKDWPTNSGFHLFGGGMAIRNWLRDNGFGEEFFKIENLDYIYTNLLELAVLGELLNEEYIRFDN